ncbi:nuclear transport factor 2 family protein [Pseudonocardia xinjiangensis]|uniref:nuclear transport factor 2 family protein n=1 Tax=Pseudonocardia xinjiangensis TaxID=75289 RepID=UPI003D907821
MSSTTETILDRYIALSDRAVHNPEALELRLIFAPDATVQIFDEPVHGIEAIMEFYWAHVATQADSKHFWNTRVLNDGSLDVERVVVARMANGSLLTTGGVERASVNSDGLITDLRNRFTRV